MDNKNLSAIQIQGINAQTLLSEVKSIVKNEVQALKKQTMPKGVKLLTRQQTAKLLSVSLVTLHHWTKKGILRPYKIGNKVRYKECEILQTLESTRSKKGVYNG